MSLLIGISPSVPKEDTGRIYKKSVPLLVPMEVINTMISLIIDWACATCTTFDATLSLHVAKSATATCYLTLCYNSRADSSAFFPMA